jgi:hypothetical protein
LIIVFEHNRVGVDLISASMDLVSVVVIESEIFAAPHIVVYDAEYPPNYSSFTGPCLGAWIFVSSID